MRVWGLKDKREPSHCITARFCLPGYFLRTTKHRPPFEPDENKAGQKLRTNEGNEMDAIKQTIQELIDYDDSLEPHKPIPSILASLADATDEETIRHFVMFSLLWLYHNGRKASDRLEQRKDNLSISYIKHITDAKQDGLKSVPVLCDVFVINGDTLSYVDTMSYADRLALEQYVAQHYSFYMASS